MRKPKPEEHKESQKAKDKEKKPEKKRREIEGVRGVVRLAEVNLEGTKKIKNAILGIKGIGKSLANGVVIASGLDPQAMIGSFSDEQLHKLEDVMKNPSKYGIPYHMLNRRLDPSDGTNKHLISSELSFANKGDIDFMKKIRCYKGIRHELGLPVRGQRTRSSFRTGMIVGVTKGKQKPGAPVTPTAAAGAPGTPTPAAKPGETAKPGAPAPAKAPAAAKAPASAKPEKKEEKK